MDSIARLHFNWKGQCQFDDYDLLVSQLGSRRTEFLQTVLSNTCIVLKEFSLDLHYSLVGKPVRIRISEKFTGTIQLTPHDLLFNANLLDYSKGKKAVRKAFLTGLFERGFFHWCNPEMHFTQAIHHSLHFHQANPRIYKATVEELKNFEDNPKAALWLDLLNSKDSVITIEKFWDWFASHEKIEQFLKTGTDQESKKLARLQKLVNSLLPAYKKATGPITKNQSDCLKKFVFITNDPSWIVIEYQLTEKIKKVIRVCAGTCIDAMSAPCACYSIKNNGLRTDIFYDCAEYITPWIQRLEDYRKDPSLKILIEDLTSFNPFVVHSAIDALVSKIRRKESTDIAMRLLYSALYYNANQNKGLSRSIRLRVSKLLEDMLTERPIQFPRSKENRAVLKGEKAVVNIKIPKPYRIKKTSVTARIRWAVNGRMQRHFLMDNDPAAETKHTIAFTAQLTAKRGWIHYSVQVSHDEGKTWKNEIYDENSQGLIKFISDERGKRVLSIYTDTFNLQLNDDNTPKKDRTGAYVHGTFETIADQLEDIKAEGYTRIYPLGALELGWAGEAGPDPSVFSIWDGKTVRTDMGGLDALINLRKKADKLGMKIVLCVLSHFSRANHSYPYHFPVYIYDKTGNLTRRAGWDGEWDEWYDSFMVNMRDFENVRHLASIYEELTSLGFGLRIDVGHGFDTVFPVHPNSSSVARLLGQIGTDGFETIDLRGSWQPNIALLYLCYRAQKSNPNVPVVYAEQWHGNEVRMIKASATPYNSVIKNLENIRNGEDINQPLGLNDNLRYLRDIALKYGGQTISMFNTHDEESPASNYQNMIWPVAAFLVFSSYGPIMYHISRLPGSEQEPFRKRFDLAYLECWKHWVNNRFLHPWQSEEITRNSLIEQYPLLKGFGTYLRSLFNFADENHALTKGTITPIRTNNGRIAAFVRSYHEQSFLCVFNFPNPHPEGQAAISRDFNFQLRNHYDHSAVPNLVEDAVYELKERYNNVEGRQRRGQREYWSGRELLNLGFGGSLQPVSSHVYEIIYRDHSINERFVLIDSFLRYVRYGIEVRLKHAYIALEFSKATDPKTGNFKRFVELYDIIVTWIVRQRKLDVSDFSLLLDEISRDNPNHRNKIIEFLMRIACNENKNPENILCSAAVDILQSINVGTIALVSPESKFSGASGGVGIYTTDIADTLSEMGFKVVIVTPLYEANRQQVFDLYSPKFEGHKLSVNFPRFYDDSQSTGCEGHFEIVNIYRSRLIRHKHGKRATIEVLYLENKSYFDRPYSGSTAEDKLRRARLLSHGAIEALRCYNYYPAVIQTNEWPTWMIPAYLKKWNEFRNDEHFAKTQTVSMLHNPHPAYSITLDEANPNKRAYFGKVIGLDPYTDNGLIFDHESPSGHEINLTHIMLASSEYIGTVSRAMRQRIIDESWLFGHGRLFHEKMSQGKFFSRRNGFNMGARQRFWFGSKKSILETYDRTARRRLFRKYTQIKGNAKVNLQSDPNIDIRQDDENTDHVIFGMLHRICKQKGFELLLDWKVYTSGDEIYVEYEPWNMGPTTVLEYFLSTSERIQYVICGSVEDSMDGRRFDMHLRRIKSDPKFRDRFGYFPQGALPPSLYRNLYIGCQYFVMPSGGDIGEPCGISQQEAHAGGTPVVAHNQDGLMKTVSDRDFGDTHNPANGVKFAGFTGNKLLEALLDAVEIYTKGQRRSYKNENGEPKKARYSDLSYNAFLTDHRWTRLLWDYVGMYARIQNVKLPEYLKAIQLIAETTYVQDRALGDVILRMGMQVPEAVDSLVDALHCRIPSVRRAASNTLVKLSQTDGIKQRIDIRGRLRRACESDNKILSTAARTCLEKL